MHWCGWGSSPWWWAMMVFMALFWIAVIGGIVWLIVSLTTRSGSGSVTANNDIPLDMLKKRYARGEISKKDFDRTKQDIQ